MKTLKQQLQQEFTYTCTTIALEKFKEWLTQKQQKYSQAKDWSPIAADIFIELIEELNQ